jgi:hypothetical protein
MCITSEPLFPLEDDDLSLDLSQSCVDVPLLPESANQLDFEAFGVEKTVSDLMGNVRHLCRVFSYKAIQVIHRKDAVRGGDVHSMVNLIAQRLLHIKPLASVDPGSSGARITDACRFASLLFLFLPFDNHWPDPTFVTNSFLRGLKAALSSLVPSSGIENQLQIWLLAVGGVAELNPPEREWFIRRLVAVAADLELESWDDVEHCLERVIWIKAFNDSRFRQLWKEVRLASESMAMQNPFHGIRYCPRILQGTEKQASKLRELIL